MKIFLKNIKIVIAPSSWLQDNTYQISTGTCSACQTLFCSKWARQLLKFAHLGVIGTLTLISGLVSSPSQVPWGKSSVNNITAWKSCHIGQKPDHSICTNLFSFKKEQWNINIPIICGCLNNVIIWSNKLIKIECANSYCSHFQNSEFFTIRPENNPLYLSFQVLPYAP